jgi:hypothetical protein
VTFNPTLPLPDSITLLNLEANQMTNAGYTGSEPWANAMSVIGGREVRFGFNPDSAGGTTLESILISKGWIVNT